MRGQRAPSLRPQSQWQGCLPGKMDSTQQLFTIKIIQACECGDPVGGAGQKQSGAGGRNLEAKGRCHEPYRVGTLHLDKYKVLPDFPQTHARLATVCNSLLIFLIFRCCRHRFTKSGPKPVLSAVLPASIVKPCLRSMLSACNEVTPFYTQL